VKVPPGLKYTDSHEWVRWESDGSATVGITDFAQQSLGDLVFVELPAVGREVAEGQACAVVESVKAASDVYAPISGKVLAVNEALADHPEAINADAFEAWLFRLQPAAADHGPGTHARLIEATAYAGQIGKH
jgi:glycine cleavage system H protein